MGLPCFCLIRRRKWLLRKSPILRKIQPYRVQVESGGSKLSSYTLIVCNSFQSDKHIFRLKKQNMPCTQAL
ncbi:unnamed protein product [Microthlaspi erraticum]|uniref:Uncharacterized protein n=1 Tax=Microthlaspi erraticum TaxID=1685480 RepID=A0A6D2L2Y3_9BRAS|nr:unnamed protein product [Microthlaspi erraticum]